MISSRRVSPFHAALRLDSALPFVLCPVSSLSCVRARTLSRLLERRDAWMQFQRKRSGETRELAPFLSSVARSIRVLRKSWNRDLRGVFIAASYRSLRPVGRSLVLVQIRRLVGSSRAVRFLDTVSEARGAANAWRIVGKWREASDGARTTERRRDDDDDDDDEEGRGDGKWREGITRKLAVARQNVTSWTCTAS